MAGMIKVNTAALSSTATEFGSKGNQVNALAQEMIAKVTSLTGSWAGDASSAYIAKFKGLEKDIAVLNKMIQEHVSDLQTIAINYKTAEDQNTQLTSCLTSGVIF